MSGQMASLKPLLGCGCSGQNDNYPRQHVAIDKSPQNIGATLKYRFEIYNIYILHWIREALKTDFWKYLGWGGGGICQSQVFIIFPKTKLALVLSINVMKSAKEK